MAIDLTTNIKTNAPRPLDAKTYVGTGQEYTGKYLIPIIYRYEGMKVYDVDTNIEWELIKLGYAQSFAGYENAGYGYFWKNISFGATPLFYKQSGYTGVWINEDTINMSCQTNETITLSAVIFGNVKKIQWTIQKQNGTPLISNKETLTYVFSTIGTYTIKFKIWDYFGNTLEYSYSMLATAIDIPNVSSFTVTPTAGIKANGSRDYIFNVVTTENIEYIQIEQLNISYVNSLDETTSVSLISETGFVSGIVVNEKTILVNNLSAFKNLTLDENTDFILSYKIVNKDVIEATATYSSVDKIIIDGSNSTVTYNTTTDVLIATVRLFIAHDDNSTVNGTININGSAYSLIANSDKRTFTYSNEIELSPATYILPVTLTQSVYTGTGTETYITTSNLELVIAPPEYAVTIFIKDDLDIPEAVIDSTITVLRYASPYNTYSGEDGSVIIYLPAGEYTASASKDYYTSSQSYPFTITNSSATFTLTLEPIRSFSFTGVTNVQPGEICYVNYDLLPDDKYETDCDITYTIISEGLTVTTTTKNLIIDGSSFNTYLIDESYALMTLRVLITSYYQDQTPITKTMNYTIGSAVPYWGILESIEDFASTEVTEVISEVFTNEFILSSQELTVISETAPIMLFQNEEDMLPEGVTFPEGGYTWAAFPSDYTTYTLYRTANDGGTYADLSDFMYTGTKEVNGETYTIYISKGLLSPLPDPYFGLPIYAEDAQFSY